MGSITHAKRFKVIAFINYGDIDQLKYFKAKNTTIGIVIKDIKVDITMVLAILSTTFFGEYMLPTK